MKIFIFSKFFIWNFKIIYYICVISAIIFLILYEVSQTNMKIEILGTK